MSRLLIAVLLSTLSLEASALLCFASTDTGKKVFMFVNNKPTKTLSGTVEKIKNCSPHIALIEDVNAGKDACLSLVYTYVNRDTKEVETYYYKNGATSADGITWDREQNPLCPAIQ